MKGWAADRVVAAAALLALAAACADPPADGPPARSGPVEPEPSFYQEAVWSPDGRRLALSFFDADHYEIHVIEADGSARDRLTTSPGSHYWSSWSPDGTRLAFGSTRGGERDIWAIDVESGREVRLTTDTADDSSPAWSPDGRRIAFSSKRDAGRWQLWVMDADGSNPERVLRATADHYNPAWSADGRRLAFYASDESGDHVEVVNADGTGHARIAEGVFPAWFPDGRIAFDRADTVFVADTSGPVTALIANAFAARIAPDGGRIAFVRGDWPVSGVFLANADGSDVRPLVVAR